MPEDIGRILKYAIDYFKGWSVHGTAGSRRTPTAWRTCRSASST